MLKSENYKLFFKQSKLGLCRNTVRGKTQMGLKILRTHLRKKHTKDDKSSNNFKIIS